MVIARLRRQQLLLLRAVLPFAVVGELDAFALKADWGYQKVAFLRQLLERYPLVGFVPEVAGLYARLDAYSQGRLRGQPLPAGLSARNMGKNDLWIAATSCTRTCRCTRPTTTSTTCPPWASRWSKNPREERHSIHLWPFLKAVSV